MSTSTVDYDALAKQYGATDSTPAPAQQTPATGGGVDYDALAKQFGATDSTNPPGEVTNDVGNTVIVPKDGESFSDTLKRAVVHQKSMTTDQQQAAIDKETATIPTKTAETLGAAAGIGAAGPALLAAPGEIADAIPAMKNFVLKKLAEQTPELFGHEAVKETLKRYALEGIQKAVTGAEWAGGAKILSTIWDDVFGKKK